MTTPSLATLLIVFSALTHALVVAVLKKAQDKLTARTLLDLTGSAVCLPLLFLVPSPSGSLWLWLAASLFCHFLYQLAQVEGLRAGDYGVVYPISRGSAPLITTLGAASLFGEPIGAIDALGIATISLGVILLALEPGRLDRSHRAGLSVAVALLTGFCAALYTLVDAQGVRAAESFWTFAVWFFAFDGLILAGFTLSRRRAAFLAAARRDLTLGISAGLLGIGTYGAALAAFRIGPTAEIAAMRETSIVFALAIGALFLGEPLGLRRILCALIIVAGAVAIRLF